MAKKAIVMGATSGIGMEVAKLLAAKGWQVGIAGRRIERLQALISQGGITCYQQIDVTSPDAPAQLLELIERSGGPLKVWAFQFHKGTIRTSEG